MVRSGIKTMDNLGSKDIGLRIYDSVSKMNKLFVLLTSKI